jgi:hypothetical protein
MNRQEFADYSSTAVWKHFKPEADDVNEVIVMMYNFIQASVLKGCDTICVTPTRLVRSKGGREIYQWDITSAEEAHKQTGLGMSFREALVRILERDSVLRDHLRSVQEAPEELKYEFVFRDEPGPK